MIFKYRLNATRAYLMMELASAIFLSLVFTTNSLYEVTVAGLAPLQLVLIGTTLEVSTFLFEVPTGIVADAYSWRLSIVLGYMLIGFGLLIEGSFPSFWPIVLSSAIWGLGYSLPVAQNRPGSRTKLENRLPTNCSCALPA
jgi:MFS transporter, DHA3 family, tetracycline resistance protein